MYLYYITQLYIYIGGACRTRVNKYLCKKFETPDLAEKYFERDENTGGGSHAVDGEETETQHMPLEDSSTSDDNITSVDIQAVDIWEQTCCLISEMKPDAHLSFISRLIFTYCSKLQVSIPEDFLLFAAKGMEQLQRLKRNNMLYALAKGLGTQ